MFGFTINVAFLSISILWVLSPLTLPFAIFIVTVLVLPFHTAYNTFFSLSVAFVSSVALSSSLYVGVPASLSSLQPKNVYPSLVKVFFLRVLVVLYG